MGEWFKSGVIKKLLRLLEEPGRYDQSEAVMILLRVVAKYYAVSLKLLRAIGVTETEGSPADIVSSEVHQEIVVGNIDAQHQVEDMASLKLDRRLFAYGNTSLSAARYIDNFYHKSFTNLVEKDKHVKTWCRDPELRERAFNDAFLGFMRTARKEGEVLRSGGRNLFFDILRKKCITAIDRAKPGNRSIAADIEDQIKSQLGSFKFSAPPAADLVLTKADLELLRPGNEKCYYLLMSLEGGLENKDLAKIHNTSVGAIADRIYRCRIKMWDKFQKLK